MKYVFNVPVAKCLFIITFGRRCGLDSQAFGHGWTIQKNDTRSARADGRRNSCTTE
jgi:hypothetical protein